jgi:(p)ppGpp synthase/HD superfamily hydrolase
MRRYVNLAKITAKRWHSAQTYGNDSFFNAHLSAVADIVVGLGGSTWDETIAYLHDILEDTFCDPNDLLEIFPTSIVDTVKVLTRADWESYEDYMARILRNPKAAFIKYADSSANLAACRREAEIEIEENGKVSEKTMRRIGKYINNLERLSVVIGISREY